MSFEFIMSMSKYVYRLFYRRQVKASVLIEELETVKARMDEGLVICPNYLGLVIFHFVLKIELTYLT